MSADQILQHAVALHRQGRVQEAAQLYQQALQVDPEHVDALHLLGAALLQAGQAQQALPFLQKAVTLRPDFADAHANLGAVLRRAGRPADALSSFERAVHLNPKLVEALVGCANALFELGRNDEALKKFDAALQLAPGHAFAHCNRGAVLQVLQRHADALGAFDRAIAIAPQMAEAHANRGNTLRELNRPSDAVAACDRALALRPNYAAALTYRGFALLDLDQLQEALASFEAARRANPADVRAMKGHGRALAALGRHESALASYDAALARVSSDAYTHLHKSLSFWELDRFDDALMSVNEALSLDVATKGAHHVRGNILVKQGKRAEAFAEFRKEYELHPETDYALGHYLSAALGQCVWDDYDQLVETLTKRVRAGEEAATPFELSLVSSSGSLLRLNAEAHARYHKPIANVSAPLRGGGGGQRVRIGYFSSDFMDHPVAHLLAGVLASHDRERFEVWAYALGGRRDGYTERVRANVDRFIDCAGVANAEIVEQARRDGIDVAVDLNGYTSGSQTRLFSTRVAPVQMSYIGYLGTMGASFMDYLIVDGVIAPEDDRAWFTEKLITLPWYQCNDVAEDGVANPLGRAHYGLPEDAFVFASFNNTFKITPDMFAAWMRILQRTPRSVLWLYAADQTARRNLEKEATARGVDVKRIVFADGVPRAEHLARQRLANLMLDTFPYNGGATTSNALRAGVPVLTLKGEAFASRMGASLLIAAGAAELVAETVAEYEEKAVQFVLEDGEASAAARNVARAHATRLYDPAAFARHLEQGLAIAVERARAGLPAEDIVVR